MRIELLTAPGCPHAATAKKSLTACLATVGIEAMIIERVGRFPSPTILIDGIDVMGRQGVSSGDMCRLDLPTPQRIREALGARNARASGSTTGPRNRNNAHETDCVQEG